MNLKYINTHLAGQSVQFPAQALRPQASLGKDKSDSRDPPVFYGKSTMNDLPAFKHYLSTCYHRKRATTKLTPANFFQLISSAFPFRSAAQVWLEDACTSIEEAAAQPDKADALLICSFAH